MGRKKEQYHDSLPYKCYYHNVDRPSFSLFLPVLNLSKLAPLPVQGFVCLWHSLGL